MERKFNKFGKPLPNKSDLRFLPIVDKIIRQRLESYIQTQLDDWVSGGEEYWSDFEEQLEDGQFDTTDTELLAELLFNGEDIRDKNGTPLYYIFLKIIMDWFFDSASYESLKSSVERGSWEKGWMPDVMNGLGFSFEESYALVLLWLHKELGKFGTSISAIKKSLKEGEMKNLIKKILKEQIVKHDHEICSILTCNELREVLSKIKHNRLNDKQRIKLKGIIDRYDRDVKNNLKDVPKSGGLKGATGDSEKDFCDEYLHQIQTLICEPIQE
jgi:hypothetical protein